MLSPEVYKISGDFKKFSETVTTTELDLNRQFLNNIGDQNTKISLSVPQ